MQAIREKVFARKCRRLAAINAWGRAVNTVPNSNNMSHEFVEAEAMASLPTGSINTLITKVCHAIACAPV